MLSDLNLPLNFFKNYHHLNEKSVTNTLSVCDFVTCKKTFQVLISIISFKKFLMFDSRKDHYFFVLFLMNSPSFWQRQSSFLFRSPW
jgi:hypothetical protein